MEKELQKTENANAVREASAEPEVLKSKVYDALLDIQAHLHAPKDRVAYDLNGRPYPYCTLGGILQAAKPFFARHSCTLVFRDEVRLIEGHLYMVSTAILRDSFGESVEIPGFAREEVTVVGKRACQITGTCSTYARKYALNALFAIDDSLADPISDPDASVQTIAGTLSSETAAQMEREKTNAAEETDQQEQNAPEDTDGTQPDSPAGDGSPAPVPRDVQRPSQDAPAGRPQADGNTAPRRKTAGNILNQSNPRWMTIVTQCSKLNAPTRESVRSQLEALHWVVSEEDLTELLIQAGKG